MRRFRNYNEYPYNASIVRKHENTIGEASHVD